jgi:hypothetical protein
MARRCLGLRGAARLWRMTEDPCSVGQQGEMSSRFIGIDVQSARGCAVGILDEDGRAVDSAWIPGSDPSDLAIGLVRRLRADATSTHTVAIGIDAPRQPLDAPREWFWDGGRKRWRRRRPSESGRGRHCEIVIAAHQLAHPQWTPLEPDAPEWMRVGFALFRALTPFARVLEVFPAASYRLLSGTDLRLEVTLKGFADGPKDMLDAFVGALTTREFCCGRGTQVGGGDGLGTIILPRPLTTPIPEVFTWPAA